MRKIISSPHNPTCFYQFSENIKIFCKKSVVIRFFPYAVTVGTVGILCCGSALFIEYAGYAAADVVGLGKRTDCEMSLPKWTILDKKNCPPVFYKVFKHMRYQKSKAKCTSSWQKVRPWRSQRTHSRCGLVPLNLNSP